MARVNRAIPAVILKLAAVVAVGGLLIAAAGPATQAELKDPTKSTGLSDFPCAVEFEQGAVRFRAGDNIKITEVRGTSEKFARGHLYLVKGTYSLGSRDRATLAAYITATDPKNASGPSLKVQHLTIERGTGTFSLFLPMYCDGLPHVSFYPADSGEGFGGNYFGTGDSVLKRWWGDKD